MGSEGRRVPPGLKRPPAQLGRAATRFRSRGEEQKTQSVGPTPEAARLTTHRRGRVPSLLCKTQSQRGDTQRARGSGTGAGGTGGSRGRRGQTDVDTRRTGYSVGGRRSREEVLSLGCRNGRLPASTGTPPAPRRAGAEGHAGGAHHGPSGRRRTRHMAPGKFLGRNVPEDGASHAAAEPGSGACAVRASGAGVQGESARTAPRALSVQRAPCVPAPTASGTVRTLGVTWNPRSPRTATAAVRDPTPEAPQRTARPLHGTRLADPGKRTAQAHVHAGTQNPRACTALGDPGGSAQKPSNSNLDPFLLTQE